MLEEAKETQQVGTARVAFFGFDVFFYTLLFCLFVSFVLCFFGGLIFSGEAASVTPRAAKGGGERPAKRTAVQETKETKETNQTQEGGEWCTLLGFGFMAVFFVPFFLHFVFFMPCFVFFCFLWFS